MAGTLMFILAAVVAAIPAIRSALGGQTADFGVISSYLFLVLLAALAAIAAGLSWTHEPGMFSNLMVFMWLFTLIILRIDPPVALWFGGLGAVGSFLFFEAERSGATGLGLSLSRPTPQPEVDYVLGGDLSKTRTGLIDEYRRNNAAADRSEGTTGESEPDEGHG